jgi:SAM-dependent methyltransferase
MPACDHLPQPRHAGARALSAQESRDRAPHWDAVYTQKEATAVSWYREHLDASLQLLEHAGLSPQSRVIDVGGGASSLVDDLLARGVARIDVLDLSAAAIEVAKARLGARAATVRWWIADVVQAPLPAAGYTHWHDRAVMHFLTTDADLHAYAAQAARALVVGGHAAIGGFAPDGPERCSGLPVARRSAAQIGEVLGACFVLVESHEEWHRTPGGTAQHFSYGLFRRV